ncbi:hypothetical protein ACIBK1_40010 [Microbispora rosea]|uniref:hypothetical protein n=1 Tax=Microbispora rosea TaxID=58117 RepID=UPI00378F2813
MTSPGQERAFLRRLREEGAQQLGVARFGRHDRIVGKAATAGDGRFRVRTAEHHGWAHGDAGTGNRDAAAITGVSTPVLIASVEWDELPATICAELLSYAPDRPCSRALLARASRS